jgi:hypothetical protein
LNALRLPVFEHPMFPKDTSGLGEFELPLRVGLVFDTTLAATRMIYGGVFERYPDFPYVLGHTGGAIPVGGMLHPAHPIRRGGIPDTRPYSTKPAVPHVKVASLLQHTRPPDVVLIPRPRLPHVHHRCGGKLVPHCAIRRNGIPDPTSLAVRSGVPHPVAPAIPEDAWIRGLLTIPALRRAYL